jgi:hypothetical protein
LKKGDVINDAYDDDEVITIALQNRVTATLSSEEFFLRTHYIYVALPSYQKISVGGGQEINSQLDTYRRSQLGQLPAGPPYCRTGFTKPVQLFCDWGRQIKPIFVIYGDTLRFCIYIRKRNNNVHKMSKQHTVILKIKH